MPSAMSLAGPIRTLLVLAIGVFVLGSAAEANAAPGAAAKGLSIAANVFSAQNPETAYRALSTTDRAAFNAVERVAHAEQTTKLAGMGANANTNVSHSAAAVLKQNARPGASVSAAFNGCWAMQVSGGATAAAGNTLYTYGQSTQVCVANSRVTGVAVYNVWDETSTPGWRVDKPATTRTFNAGWEGRGLAQYYFVLGAGPWDIAHPTTCLQLRLNGDGSHYASSRSCNLS